jgi:hypothetical protein
MVSLHVYCLRDDGYACYARLRGCAGISFIHECVCNISASTYVLYRYVNPYSMYAGVWLDLGGDGCECAWIIDLYECHDAWLCENFSTCAHERCTLSASFPLVSLPKQTRRRRRKKKQNRTAWVSNRNWFWVVCFFNMSCFLIFPYRLLETGKRRCCWSLVLFFFHRFYEASEREIPRKKKYYQGLI